MTVTLTNPSPAGCRQVSTMAILTVRKSLVTELPLQRWVDAAPADETRFVEPLHDTLSVVWERDHEVGDGIESIADTLGELGIDPVHALGGTTVVFVPCDEGVSSSHDVLRRLGFHASRGGAWTEDADLFATESPEVLVVVSRGDEDVTAVTAQKVASEIRLVELLRHKVIGQQEAYEANIRPKLLSECDLLSESLEQLSRCSGRIDSCSPQAVLDASQSVIAAYCRMSLHQAPALQAQAMLDANLSNLGAAIDRVAPPSPAAGVKLLRQRAEDPRLLAHQVRADLGRVEPVASAARCVSQFHHGQVLSQLAATELEDNRLEKAAIEQRERQTWWLMVLGLWIGLNQIWATWVGMWPSQGAPADAQLLTYMLAPAAIAGTIYALGTVLPRNPKK